MLLSGAGDRRQLALATTQSPNNARSISTTRRFSTQPTPLAPHHRANNDPHPHPPPQADGGRDYIPDQVGQSLYDSLKILGLGLGASECEVKSAYRRLACLYHPDKWEQARETTGMTLQETNTHFQLLNNAQAFLHHTLTFGRNQYKIFH